MARYELIVPKDFNPESPVLFLDIDGVLNSEPWMAARGHSLDDIWADEDIDPAAVARLNRLVVATNPVVILSSSWRAFYSPAAMTELLVRRGFVGQVTGCTGPRMVVDDRWGRRGHEIAHWRRRAAHVGPFVILDDDTDMEGVERHHIATTWKEGLQDEHVERAVALLKVSPAKEIML